MQLDKNFPLPRFTGGARFLREPSPTDIGST